MQRCRPGAGAVAGHLPGSSRQPSHRPDLGTFAAAGAEQQTPGHQRSRASAARRGRSTPPAAGPSPTNPVPPPLAPVECAPTPGALSGSSSSGVVGHTGPVINSDRRSQSLSPWLPRDRRSAPRRDHEVLQHSAGRGRGSPPDQGDVSRPAVRPCALGSCTNLRSVVVWLPGSSSTPRPGPRSAHSPRVACPPLPLRTRRCGPRATRTGAPGHQHHVGERELSASAGPTVPMVRVHCRPAGAGGGSPTRRHRGSPTCTSSRPDHARPPVVAGDGSRAASRTPRVDSPPLPLWPRSAVLKLCHRHRSTRRQQTINHP